MIAPKSSSALWRLTLCLLLLANLATAGEVSGKGRRVLVLHSFGQDFAPYVDFSLAFRSTLNTRLGPGIEYLDVSLLTVKSDGSTEDEPLLTYLTALVSQDRPDVTIALGAPAVRLSQRYREQIFLDTPLILSAFDERLLRDDSLTENDAVVALRNDVTGLVENILQVLPDTEHVVVVLGASPLERFWADEFRRELQPFSNRLRFTWFNDLTFEQMKQEVAKLPPRSAVLYMILLADAAGIPHLVDSGLRGLKEASNSPVFGTFLSHVQRGTVGGRLVSDLELGQIAGNVAARILEGEVPATLSTEALGPGTPTYNSTELKRWGISESTLPAGSIVLFRQPTFWKQYARYILAAGAALILQTALIGALLWQRARRRRAEQESASLGGRMLTFYENEHRRIARELHDDVTQRLAALAIEASSLEAGQRAARPEAALSIREGLVKLSEDVHSLSYRLHPSVIEDLGLVHALKAECSRAALANTFKVSLVTDGTPEKLPTDLALCLFRITQEALRNVGRHANASTVDVTLMPMDDGLSLSIHDNGIGFDKSRQPLRPSLGHASMQERVNLLDGKIEIESQPGKGTTVFVWVPLPAAST
jgi:signal transduction histidine kinase